MLYSTASAEADLGNLTRNKMLNALQQQKNLLDDGELLRSFIHLIKAID